MGQVKVQASPHLIVTFLANMWAWLTSLCSLQVRLYDQLATQLLGLQDGEGEWAEGWLWAVTVGWSGGSASPWAHWHQLRGEAVSTIPTAPLHSISLLPGKGEAQLLKGPWWQGWEGCSPVVTSAVSEVLLLCRWVGVGGVSSACCLTPLTVSWGSWLRPACFQPL